MRSVCGIAFLILHLPLPAAAQEPSSREFLNAVEKQLQSTIATAGPSIACIVVSRSDQYPKPKNSSDIPGKLGGFDRNDFLKKNPVPERIPLANTLDLSDPQAIPDHGYGNGVVIDSSGLVLTPYHLISGATKIYVHLHGGGSYADIHAADSRSDLAVLKLINPPKKLTPIAFADVRTRAIAGRKPTVVPGKLVVLMALAYSPQFRLDRPSAKMGSITNVRYRIHNPKGEDEAPEKQASYYKHAPLLEHDITLNANVSGSALLNLDGELVGLSTAAAVVYDNREIGPGFAIPADDNFHRIVDVLRRGEEIEYGFLGIALPRVKLRQEAGIEVGSVTVDGPAAKGRIESGDLITHINDHPIADYDDLLLYIGSALAGTKTRITVISPGGRSREAIVTLAKFANEQPFIASVRPEPPFGLRVDYTSTRPVSAGNARRFDSELRIPPGVYPREPIANSPAATAFKELGDDWKRWTIVKVNDTAITTPAEFYKAATGQEKIKLLLRDAYDPGREREITLP